MTIKKSLSKDEEERLREQATQMYKDGLEPDEIAEKLVLPPMLVKDFIFEGLKVERNIKTNI